VFEFDISRFKLPTGSQLTVTASYLAPEGFFLPADFTSIVKSDTGVVITWTGNATLQSAPSLDGPWSDEFTTGNSYEADVSDPLKFFRLESSGSAGGSGAPPMTSPFSNVVMVQ
jgi:hypothetical protein